MACIRCSGALVFWHLFGAVVNCPSARLSQKCNSGAWQTTRGVRRRRGCVRIYRISISRGNVWRSVMSDLVRSRVNNHYRPADYQWGEDLSDSSTAPFAMHSLFSSGLKSRCVWNKRRSMQQQPAGPAAWACNRGSSRDSRGSRGDSSSSIRGSNSNSDISNVISNIISVICIIIGFLECLARKLFIKKQSRSFSIAWISWSCDPSMDPLSWLCRVENQYLEPPFKHSHFFLYYCSWIRVICPSKPRFVYF